MSDTSERASEWVGRREGGRGGRGERKPPGSGGAGVSDGGASHSDNASIGLHPVATAAGFVVVGGFPTPCCRNPAPPPRRQRQRYAHQRRRGDNWPRHVTGSRDWSCDYLMTRHVTIPRDPITCLTSSHVAREPGPGSARSVRLGVTVTPSTDTNDSEGRNAGYQYYADRRPDSFTIPM